MEMDLDLDFFSDIDNEILAKVGEQTEKKLLSQNQPESMDTITYDSDDDNENELAERAYSLEEAIQSQKPVDHSELAAAVFDDEDDYQNPSLDHLDCSISSFKHNSPNGDVRKT